MPIHAFDVKDLFEIENRGVIVFTNKTYRQLDSKLALKIGASIEFRLDGRPVLRSRIAAIELAHWSPPPEEEVFTFFLPRELRKENVPLNAEIWVED
jgi:hypothetical protein